MTGRLARSSTASRVYARTMQRPLALAAALSVLALAAAPAAAAATLPGFHSPSGNIRCLLLAGRPANLLCTVGQGVYTKQLQNQCSARASLDWHGFMLPAARKGAPECSGGILYTQRPSYVNL